MSKKNNFFSHLIDTGEFRINDEGQATLFGDYMFLLPPRVLLHLQKRLEEEIGKQEAENLLQEIGRYQVHSGLERYEERLNIGDISRDEIIDFAMQLMSILGIGDPSMEKVSEEEAILSLENPTFATEYKHFYGNAEEGVDFYIRGIVEEFFEDIIFREGCTVVETECAATGESDVCVFRGVRD
jgi:predicted hydrocarbon binding protein